MHEEMRTFKDRLINDEDQTWFDNLLEAQLKKHFQVTVRDILTPCQGTSAEVRTSEITAHSSNNYSNTNSSSKSSHNNK